MARHRIIFKHESATVHLSAGLGNTATLHNLYSEMKGRGHATEAMRKLCTYADENSLIVNLMPRPYDNGGLDKDQLVEFYTRFGFKALTQRATLMTREPR